MGIPCHSRSSQGFPAYRSRFTRACFQTSLARGQPRFINSKHGDTHDSNHRSSRVDVVTLLRNLQDHTLPTGADIFFLSNTRRHSKSTDTNTGLIPQLTGVTQQSCRNKTSPARFMSPTSPKKAPHGFSGPHMTNPPRSPCLAQSCRLQPTAKVLPLSLIHISEPTRPY